MLFKTIKHDLVFGARTFLAMGGIALFVGILLIVRFGGDYFAGWLTVVGLFAFGVLGLVCVIQVFQLFSKSIFGRAGYLSLTIPIKRGTALASKLIVAMIWFAYFAVIAVVVVALSAMIAEERGLDQVIEMFTAERVVWLVSLFIIAFAAICTMFFATTLANSVFAGRRIHGIVAGAFAFVYAWAFVWIYVALDGRWLVTVSGVRHFAGTTTYWTSFVPQTGLRYGRIVIETLEFGREVFIDIFQWGLALAFAAAAIAGTLYLLKRRISLK